MSVTIEQYGTATLKDKKYIFNLEGKKLYLEQFAEFIGRGKDKVNYKITTEEVKDPKTYKQLRYLRGIVIQTALAGFREMGHNDYCNVDQVLTKFKMWWYHEEVGGEVQPKSLKDITKEEIADFIDKIRDFSEAHLNTYIMTPDEYEKHLEQEALNKSD